MYNVGETVKYKTRINPTEKTGTIIEAFVTLNNAPCYWIENETELILEEQIVS